MSFKSAALYSTLALLPLSSCTVGPKYFQKETPVAADFSGKKEGNYANSAINTAWWRLFKDSTLNSLIERSLIANHDLRIAAANIEEARALRTQARFDFFPQVTSSGTYNNSRASLQTPFAGANRNSEVYDVGLDATWELDLWGRVRNLNSAARADLESAEAARNAVAVSITGELAQAYLELRGLQNQLSVAKRNADNQRETLKLTESLLSGGRGTELDTSRSRALLNSTLAVIPTLESAVHRNIHRISVLVGAQPSELKAQLLPARPIPAQPSLINIGNPADLLRRRPDIIAAERQVEAATLRVGVATADLFPSVTFNGRTALQSETFSNLGRSNAGTYNFGPSIRWAAFDLGRVKSQIKASDARTERKLAEYELTVLGALEETENALVQYSRQRLRRDFLRQSANASEQAATLARERYQKGVDDFLSVLDAERELLASQSALAESETMTAMSIISIYKALGGAWQADSSAK